MRRATAGITMKLEADTLDWPRGDEAVLAPVDFAPTILPSDLPTLDFTTEPVPETKPADVADSVVTPAEPDVVDAEVHRDVPAQAQLSAAGGSHGLFHHPAEAGAAP